MKLPEEIDIQAKAQQDAEQYSIPVLYATQAHYNQLASNSHPINPALPYYHAQIEIAAQAIAICLASLQE